MFKTSDDVCKYIGLAVVVLVSLYIAGRCLSFQSSMIEGLANPRKTGTLTESHFQDLGDYLDQHNDKLEDQLLVSKYKEQFEDMILKLNKNTNLQLLQIQMEYSNAIASNNAKDSAKHLDQINKLHNFNSSLNSSMKHLQ